MGPTRAPASVSPNVFIQTFSSNCSSPNPTNCWPISCLSKRATSLSSSKNIVTGRNFGGHIPVLSTQPTSSEPEINSSTTAMSGCSTDASMVFRRSMLFFCKMSGTSASIQFQRLLIILFYPQDVSTKDQAPLHGTPVFVARLLTCTSRWFHATHQEGSKQVSKLHHLLNEPIIAPGYAPCLFFTHARFCCRGAGTRRNHPVNFILLQMLTWHEHPPLQTSRRKQEICGLK